MQFNNGVPTELLQLKGRCAELELQNAQLRDEVGKLQSQKKALEEFCASQKARANSSEAQDQYTTRKEILLLTEQKSALEAQLERANETIAGLHKNITREVQKAKDEVERQSVFLRSQILEQKELNTVLQEKLITAMKLSKQLDDEGMHDNVTESILITSDAVLHKFRQEYQGAFRGKYDVHVDVSGRNMVLTGRRVNVQLVKAEVMTALNEAYSALVDPTKCVSAAKAREESSRSEIDHLRRTVMTHEATIQSLHVALQHAQNRSDSSVARGEAAERRAATAEADLAERRKQLESTLRDYSARISSLEQALRDADDTNRLALTSIQNESAVAMKYRMESESLREEIARLGDAKELAERSVFVATQQLEMAKSQAGDIRQCEQQIADLQRRLLEAETNARNVDQRVAAVRREGKDHNDRLLTEVGALQERLRQSLEDSATAKRETHSLLLERDAARAELQSSRDVIHEMRSKMVHLSVLSLESGRGHNDVSSSSSKHVPSQMESVLVGNERHMVRLEEENAALRQELQRAFEDMRTVATSLTETRLVRERAMEDVQRLEGEKMRLFEERQRAERLLVEERMSSRQRESDLELQLLSAKDELNHQRKRGELLHADYQRKIAEFINESRREVEEVEAKRMPQARVKVPKKHPAVSTAAASGVATAATTATVEGPSTPVQEAKAFTTLRSVSHEGNAFRRPADAAQSPMTLTSPSYGKTSNALESPPR